MNKTKNLLKINWKWKI